MLAWARWTCCGSGLGFHAIYYSTKVRNTSRFWGKMVEDCGNSLFWQEALGAGLGSGAGDLATTGVA
jgi:hypothetical protein